MLLLRYVIFDNSTKSYLTDKYCKRLDFDTLCDCFDYLEYILKITNFENYSFFQRMINY